MSSRPLPGLDRFELSRTAARPARALLLVLLVITPLAASAAPEIQGTTVLRGGWHGRAPYSGGNYLYTTARDSTCTFDDSNVFPFRAECFGARNWGDLSLWGTADLGQHVSGPEIPPCARATSVSIDYWVSSNDDEAFETVLEFNHRAVGAIQVQPGVVGSPLQLLSASTTFSAGPGLGAVSTVSAGIHRWPDFFEWRVAQNSTDATIAWTAPAYTDCEVQGKILSTDKTALDGCGDTLTVQYDLYSHCCDRGVNRRLVLVPVDAADDPDETGWVVLGSGWTASSTDVLQQEDEFETGRIQGGDYILRFQWIGDETSSCCSEVTEGHVDASALMEVEECSDIVEQAPFESAPCDDVTGFEDDGDCDQLVDIWAGNLSGWPVILPHSGQEQLDFVDLSVPGIDAQSTLRIKRRHLTRRDAERSPFGDAWSLNYRKWLTTNSDGDLELHGFGRSDRFEKVADEDAWLGTDGRYGRFSFNTDGDLVLRRPDGRQFVFAVQGPAASRVGILKEIRSRNGARVKLIYDPSSAPSQMLEWRMIQIIDSFDRPYFLNWSGDTVSSIVEFFSGRTVSYAYAGGSDQLETVTTPAINTGVSATQQRVHTYQYRSPSGDADADALLENALASVVFPADQHRMAPALAWTYYGDDDPLGPPGWVKSHTVGEPGAAEPSGGTYHYEYTVLPELGSDDAAIVTQVTNRAGTVTTFRLTRGGQMVSESIASTSRPALPATLKRTFTYNDDGRVLSATLPSTASRSFTHQTAPSRPRSSRADTLHRSRTPDDLRGVSHPASESSVVYDPIFHLPVRSTDPLGNVTEAVLDYMEHVPASEVIDHFWPLLGLENAAALQTLFDEDVIALGLGDLNGDGTTQQWRGNVIQVRHPDVTLPPPAPLQLAVETSRYNDFGRLIRHEDAEGNLTLHEYFPKGDPAGLLGASPSPSGAGYLGRSISDADPGDGSPFLGLVTTLEYGAQSSGAYPANARGVPTAITDPRGIKHLLQVNEADEIVESLSAADVSASPEVADLVALNQRLRLERDENGRVHRMHVDGGTNPDTVIEYEHDILGQVVTTTTDVGGLDIITEFEYDENQNLEKRTSARGSSVEQVQTWDWDERDLLISTTLSVGTDPDNINARFDFDVDADGALVAIRDAVDPTISTTIERDGYGRPIKTVNREGEEVVNTYDAASNLSSREWLGPIDDTSSANVRLAFTEWTPDERNRIYEERVHSFQYAGRQLDPTTEVLSTLSILDRLGRPSEVIDPDSDSTLIEWDGLSRLVAVTDALGNRTDRTLDPNGNLIGLTRSEVSSLLPGAEVFSQTFKHDALNRVVEMTEPNGQRTVLTRDVRGNVTKTEDQLGNEVDFHHDALDRLLWSKTWLSADGWNGSATNFAPSQGGGDGAITLTRVWDELGRLYQQVDDNGNVTTYDRDELDRLIGILYGDGTSESWVHDEDSKLLEHVLPNGAKKVYSNDAEGRPISMTVDLTGLHAGQQVSGTAIRTWGWDGMGRLVSSSDDNAGESVTYDYWYDSLSRRIREAQSLGTLPTPVATEYDWDGLGRLAALTYPNGRTVTRAHDALDRLTSINESPSGALIARYDYVGARLLRQTLGNGLVLDKRNTLGTSSIDGAGAGYDLNGRHVRQTWKDPLGVPLVSAEFTYNGPGGIGTNRITSELRTGPLPSGGSWPERRDTYGFDSAYRQISFLRNNSIPSSRELDGANKATAFLDEGVDRFPVVDGDASEAGLNQYSSLDSLPRAHGENGGLEADGTLLYSLDIDDRLVKVQDAVTTAVIAEYAYAADGRRVLTTAGGQDRRHLFAGWQVLEEHDGQVPDRQFVTGRGMDDHVQMSDLASGASYYFHSSPLGTVAGLSDSSGAPAELYEYSWLGRPTVYDLTTPPQVTITDSSGLGNPYLFQGRRWEPDLQLYDFRHRWYEPGIGEFLSVDPSGLWRHGTGNGYGAFLGDPWNVVDPLGLAPLTAPVGGPTAAQLAESNQFWRKALSQTGRQTGVRLGAAVATSQADSPAPGPADVAAAGLIGGELLSIPSTAYSIHAGMVIRDYVQRPIDIYSSADLPGFEFWPDGVVPQSVEDVFRFRVTHGRDWKKVLRDMLRPGERHFALESTEECEDARLSQHLRQLEKYGQAGSRELSSPLCQGSCRMS